MRDRDNLYLPGTDPVRARRPCGCVGLGRGRHQDGCPRKGRAALRQKAWRWLSRESRFLRAVLGIEKADVYETLQAGSTCESTPGVLRGEK
jgi:hypothetical protein